MLALVLSSFAVNSCGKNAWNVENETDRLAMIQEVKNRLTSGDCGAALTMSTLLYESSYTDNNIRMLYASSHACNMGLNLYELLDDLTTADFSSQDAIFKTLVQLFPSKAATDTRLESAIYALDALHSQLQPGVVVGPSDSTFAHTLNVGSVRPRDRTDDANIYLAFSAMALVGEALNRFGFTAGQLPSAFGYSQQVNLPWTTIGAIKFDASHQGCGLASGLLNMLDGIQVLTTEAPGSVGNSLSLVTANLLTAVDAAAHFSCDPGFGVTACTAALIRLRYHDACWEQDAIASSAAGIITLINLGWL